MKIEVISERIGATITGIDLSSSISQSTLEKITNAFLQHQVLFFPEQNLDVDQLLQFGKYFGDIAPPHPLLPPHPENAQITVILNDQDHPPENENLAYRCELEQKPPLGSALLSQDLPLNGGDTMWVSMYSVYDDLSDSDKKRFATMNAVHSIASFAGGNHDDGQSVAESIRKNPPIEHPMIRTHPQTGRQALFVNRCFTTHIVGLDEQESQDILQPLYQSIEQSNAQLRHSWEPNTLAIWDNRCTQHQAMGDYYPAYRKMHELRLVVTSLFVECSNCTN